MFVLLQKKKGRAPQLARALWCHENCPPVSDVRSTVFEGKAALVLLVLLVLLVTLQVLALD